MRRRRRRTLLLLIMLAAVGLVWLFLRGSVAPLVRDLAKATVANRGSNLINEAIQTQLETGDIDYEKLVLLEKNTSGEITALKTNIAEVNRLKTDSLTVLDQILLEMDVSEIGVPLGSVLFPTLFSGSGPKLPVKVLSISDSDAEFRNTFAQAGINQTNHQICMDVTIDMTVLTPAGTETVHVVSTVVVAETVIVGQVPQSYVNVGE